MLGYTSSMASLLSRFYNDNNKALAKSLARVASGKRVASAADDFAGFIRAAQLQIEAGLYEDVKKQLIGAKGLVDYAVQTGAAVVTDLGRLRTLAQMHSASSDPLAQASYKAEFDAVKAKMDSLVGAARYDGQQVYATGTLSTITLNPSGGSLAIDITDTASAGAIGAIDDVNVLTQIDAEMVSAATYLAEVEAYADQIDLFENLAQTASEGKLAHASAITDVNDLEELAKITDLQVRQQAIMAVYSQANISRAALAKLYENRSE